MMLVITVRSTMIIVIVDVLLWVLVEGFLAAR